MTRLEENWICSMANEMENTESLLRARTGMNYRQLAAKAAGLKDTEFDEKTKNLKVAVVTMTTGLGEIGTFAASVKSILDQMRIETFIPKKTDVNGLFEAHEKGADIIYMADDDRFIALNTKKNAVGDNNIATAKGFVAALEGAAGEPLSGKNILVIGCGVVGRLMIEDIRQKGGTPVGWDNNQAVLETLKKEQIQTLSSPEEIKNYQYVLDASSQGNWMGIGVLHPNSWYVSPGVPLSLTEEAKKAQENQMVHDLLQIGTATMLALAL